MIPTQPTLAQFLVEESRRHPGSTGELNLLILDVAMACKAVARLVATAPLRGLHGASGDINVQGETQQKLDVLSNDVFTRLTQWGGHISGMVSEELDEPYAIPEGQPRGKYLLLVDPLDGSSNIDVNMSIGSIFSILRNPHGTEPATAADHLQPGSAQVAAGYAVYGPTTTLVLTVGNGTHAFTLDPDLGEFFLSHRDMRVPESCAEFAINMSNRRVWHAGTRRYVDELIDGSTGPRGKDYNMRWVASLVADAHRILTRGGVYLYPSDTTRDGRLRLLYEAAPIAFLIEQAGGRASDGQRRLMDVVPTGIHDRVGLVFGAREEVDRVEQLNRSAGSAADGDAPESDIPLYAVRGLFRASALR